MQNRTKLHNYLVNFGISDEEYASIREKVVYSNYRNLMILGFVSIFYLLFLGIVSLFLYDDFSWLAYIVSSLLVAIAWLLNFFFTKKNNRLLKVYIYIVAITFIALGILMGIIFESDAPAVSFIGYLLLLPIIFTERPYRLFLAQFTFIASYLILAILFKTSVFLKTDIINVSLFGSLSIIVTLFLGRMKINGFLNEYKVYVLAHKDPLTGVRNRTSYEEKLTQYPSIIKKSLSCIYMDVNGLHDINNAHGHDTGDKMLITISSIVKDIIGKENTFRTGGDEFVGFLIDVDENKANETKNEILKRINESGYSVSLGLTFLDKEVLDVHQLITKAEILMYLDKEAYYEKNNDASRRSFYDK